MGQRVKLKDSPGPLGLTLNGVYSLVSQGIIPAMRVGAPGKRGRIIIDLELADEAIKKHMMTNVRQPEQEQPYERIRRVK